MRPFIPRKTKLWIGIGLAVFILADLIYLNLGFFTVQHHFSLLTRQWPEGIGLKSASPSQFSSEPLAKDCLKFQKASQYVGEAKCVEGKVDHLYQSKKGTVFISFCPDYKICPFQVVIFSSDAQKFSQLSKLKGRLVQVNGLITTYQGKAEMIIHDPSQIKVQ